MNIKHNKAEHHNGIHMTWETRIITLFFRGVCITATDTCSGFNNKVTQSTDCSAQPGSSN